MFIIVYRYLMQQGLLIMLRSRWRLMTLTSRQLVQNFLNLSQPRFKMTWIMLWRLCPVLTLISTPSFQPLPIH